MLSASFRASVHVRNGRSGGGWARKWHELRSRLLPLTAAGGDHEVTHVRWLLFLRCQPQHRLLRHDTPGLAPCQAYRRYGGIRSPLTRGTLRARDYEGGCRWSLSDAVSASQAERVPVMLHRRPHSPQAAGEGEGVVLPDERFSSRRAACWMAI